MAKKFILLSFCFCFSQYLGYLLRHLLRTTTRRSSTTSRRLPPSLRQISRGGLTTYVDSSEKGSAPIQEFVRQSDSIGFPSNSGGKDNDRRYKQNLIRPDESVYVFGTVQPRDETVRNATNAERLVVQKVRDDSMREPMFLILDDEETDLIDRRKWALWRAPLGGLYLIAAFTASFSCSDRCSVSKSRECSTAGSTVFPDYCSRWRACRPASAILTPYCVVRSILSSTSPRR